LPRSIRLDGDGFMSFEKRCCLDGETAKITGVTLPVDGGA